MHFTLCWVIVAESKTKHKINAKMEANHFRIGNWISTPLPERILEICDGWINTENHQGLPNFDIEAIDIDHDWLIRFGFSKQHNANFYILGDFGVELAREKHMVYRWHDGFLRMRGAPCDYVHQLQNLYFAIEGKELELTSKCLHDWSFESHSEWFGAIYKCKKCGVVNEDL